MHTGPPAQPTHMEQRQEARELRQEERREHREYLRELHQEKERDHFKGHLSVAPEDLPQPHELHATFDPWGSVTLDLSLGTIDGLLATPFPRRRYDLHEDQTLKGVPMLTIIFHF